MSEGFRVETAPSARHALEAVQHDKFDAALLDIKMPASTMALQEKLREIDPDMPLIIMTGYASRTWPCGIERGPTTTSPSRSIRMNWCT